MHWEQFIATCSAFGAVAGVALGIYLPFRSRQDSKIAAKEAAAASELAAKLRRDNEEKARMVVERDTELKRAISSAIATNAEQSKADMLARIDKSDERALADLAEIKMSVEALRARAEQTDLKMAVQFGGNSGGIREAVNKVAVLAEKHSEQIAALDGKFGQHLIEQGVKR
jgi:hypothetical protein